MQATRGGCHLTASRIRKHLQQRPSPCSLDGPPPALGSRRPCRCKLQALRISQKQKKTRSPAALEPKVVWPVQLVLDGGVDSTVPGSVAVGPSVVEHKAQHDRRLGGGQRGEGRARGAGPLPRAACGELRNGRQESMAGPGHTFDLGSTAAKAASTAAACSGVSVRGPGSAAAAACTPGALASSSCRAGAAATAASS